MLDSKTLMGKSILVTGGGSGLGLAMAKAFAAHGARVTIAGRTKERLEAALPEIRGGAREGGDADSFAADVRDPEQVEKLLAHAISRFGVVDGLVNNAAGNFLVTAEDLTPNGFDAVVRTVLHGSVFCTLAVGRHLLARKSPGAIVSITTTYAWTGTAFALPSACAKAGVLAMTRSLAVEWGHAGIRLNAIAPGPFPTEGATKRLRPGADFGESTKVNPMRRVGEMSELQNLATFLMADGCEWLSGETIAIDGAGYLATGAYFTELDKLSDADWERARAMIKAQNDKDRAGRSA